MSQTQTATIPDLRPVAEPGDHERMSHYALSEHAIEALVLGTPVAALCGKVWVPTRDGNVFPLCPDCEAAYDGLSEDR